MKMTDSERQMFLAQRRHEKREAEDAALKEIRETVLRRLSEKNPKGADLWSVRCTFGLSRAFSEEEKPFHEEYMYWRFRISEVNTLKTKKAQIAALHEILDTLKV